MRGPRTAMKSGPHLPQLEKALAQKRRPNTAPQKIIIILKKSNYLISRLVLVIAPVYWFSNSSPFALQGKIHNVWRQLGLSQLE